MGIIDNTVNNGVISATLITNMAETINNLYDFCADLGLDQPSTIKKGLWIRHTGNTTLNTYGAEETRFFSSAYSKPSVNATGLMATFTADFAGVFSSAPDVTVTAHVNPAKGYAFACVSNVTKDGCKIHVYNPSTTKYTGSILVNIIAIGIEAANI